MHKEKLKRQPVRRKALPAAPACWSHAAGRRLLHAARLLHPPADPPAVAMRRAGAIRRAGAGRQAGPNVPRFSCQWLAQCKAK